MKPHVENALAAARWLLLPFYLAIVVAMALLLAKTGMRTWEFATTFISLDEDQSVLAALAIIDLTLTASLLLIVALAGYVNFIASVDVKAHDNWPDWIAHVDFAELKRKLMGAIVAISAIKLLEAFMNVDHEPDRTIGWMIGVHLAFVFSALALAIGDRLSAPKAKGRPLTGP
jgi:uncharacterized protein (TIGR00645 family)